MFYDYFLKMASAVRSIEATVPLIFFNANKHLIQQSIISSEY